MHRRPGLRFLCVAALIVATSSRAHAQRLSLAATADGSGDDIYVVHVEPTVRFRENAALQPVVSLGAYYLVAGGDGSQGLTPAAGVRYEGSNVGLLAKVGWGRSGTAVLRGAAPPTMMMSVAGTANADTDPRPEPPRLAALANRDAIDPVGRERGFTASVQGDLQAAAWFAEGVASHSWGAGVLWSRARLIRHLAARSDGRTTGAGAELVWQLETVDRHPQPRYEAVQFGPVLQAARAGERTLGLSAGIKRLRATRQSTWYAKLEIAFGW